MPSTHKITVPRNLAESRVFQGMFQPMFCEYSLAVLHTYILLILTIHKHIPPPQIKYNIFYVMVGAKTI